MTASGLICCPSGGDGIGKRHGTDAARIELSAFWNTVLVCVGFATGTRMACWVPPALAIASRLVKSEPTPMT